MANVTFTVMKQDHDYCRFDAVITRKGTMDDGIEMVKTVQELKQRNPEQSFALEIKRPDGSRIYLNARGNLSSTPELF